MGRKCLYWQKRSHWFIFNHVWISVIHSPCFFLDFFPCPIFLFCTSYIFFLAYVPSFNRCLLIFEWLKLHCCLSSTMLHYQYNNCYCVFQQCQCPCILGHQNTVRGAALMSRWMSTSLYIWGIKDIETMHEKIAICNCKLVSYLSKRLTDWLSGDWKCFWLRFLLLLLLMVASSGKSHWMFFGCDSVSSLIDTVCLSVGLGYLLPNDGKEITVSLTTSVAHLVCF